MKIPSVMVPPILHGNVAARRKALLGAVLLYMTMLALIFGLAVLLLLPANKMRGLVIMGSVSTLCLVAYLMMRRGWAGAAGTLFLVGMGVVITGLSATAGGAGSIAFSGYMCIVLMAGLLFGLRGGMISISLCLAAAAGLIYAGAHGLLPPSQVRHTPVSLLVTHAIFLVWIALLVFQYTRTIESVTRNLGERVKELTALRVSAQVLQEERADLRDTLGQLAALLPPAYQFPEYAAARVRLGSLEAATKEFGEAPHLQRTEFRTSDGLQGFIEVAYPPGFPGNARNPFLAEEQALLNTLGDMLRVSHERRAADAALRQSEARLRELFDTARDTVYHLSPDGTIASLNPAFEKTTGWPREEWLGKPFGALVHPEDLGRVAEHFQNAMSGRESPLYEARVRTKPGGYVNAEFLGVPRRADGKVVGVLGIARDITERRRLEEQVRRTQRLESIGTLAGGIAHDLNNVLTPILLASDMLERHLKEDDRGLRMAASIAASAKRGSEIVRQILTFARGGDGNARPQQLNRLVGEMESFVRDTFPRNIEVCFDAPRDLPAVLGDPTQIHQILLNLCVNARDAMPEGGRLTVSASTERVAGTHEADSPAPGDYVVLTVSDTGGGMPPEIQARIFEPFFTTKPEGSGTGLGLSTTLSIVRAHHGHLRLSSEPGRGTEFRVYFPATDGAKSSERREEQIAPMGDGEIILVVDDDQAALYFIREILEANGYSVLIARNGEEGLAAFTGAMPGSVRLVITDIDMPRMNGLEFFQKLRELYPEARVLLTSGSLSAEEGVGVSSQGAFMSKPYTANELLARVGIMIGA